MQSLRKETVKHVALFEEIETSSKLIILGFGELQNLDQTNDFYFLPFQLLSQGFERVMKSHICLGYLNIYRKYPESKYIKNLGHDLLKLRNEIIEKYFKTDRPILKSDLEFLSHNSELIELLSIISEFGKMARYYNFDIITGSVDLPINAKEKWEKFESKILTSNNSMMEKLLNPDVGHEVYGQISRYIIVIFEKFMAGISRQFLFGCLGDKGKQLSIPLSDFARLYEKDFGVKDYRKNTTRYNQKSKKIHKRSLWDNLQRRFDPNIKFKRISRKDYKGEWPFIADEIIVECRSKQWCIVTIDGYDYALNGLASGRYKLETPHEVGMAIVGKNIGDFIQIALNL